MEFTRFSQFVLHLMTTQRYILLHIVFPESRQHSRSRMYPMGYVILRMYKLTRVISFSTFLTPVVLGGAFLEMITPVLQHYMS